MAFVRTDIASMTLAQNIDNNELFVVPTPLDMEDLEAMMVEFGIIEV